MCGSGIFSASYDGTIRSWLDGECVCVMRDHGGQVVYTVQLTTDGVLVSCGGDKVRSCALLLFGVFCCVDDIVCEYVCVCVRVYACVWAVEQCVLA